MSANTQVIVSRRYSGLKYQEQIKSKQISNGSRNQLQEIDAPIHDWYRFVLSFPPHLVRHYLKVFSVKKDHRILDPFCGTGTTIVECKKNGIPSIGVEAHPMPHFAASVKIDWSTNPTGLVGHASKIANEVEGILLKQGIEDNPIFENYQQPNFELEELPPNEQRLLIKNSISPLPLHKTLTLLRSMEKHSNPRYTSYERLALARALVSTIGNLHFGPEVGVGKQKKDIPVVASWMHNIRNMSSDLRSLNSSVKGTESHVLLADARSLANQLERNSIDGVFTSPPYPNEKDYTRTTRLESVLLGFIEDKQSLRDVKETLLRSNTRNVYKDDDDDQWIEGFPDIQELAEEIENKRIKLGKTSGFERMYSRVTKQYFGGMYRHFEELREVLVPGALLGYVVGDQASYLQVMIRTAQLLSRIAQSLGYETLSIDLFRTRLATATRKELREEVLILRWPG